MNHDDVTDRRLEDEAEEACQRRQAFLAAALQDNPPEEILEALGGWLDLAERYRLREPPSYLREHRELVRARRLDRALRRALGGERADALVAHYRREICGYE